MSEFAEFIEIIKSVDFEDYGSFRILSVQGEETQLRILCEIRVDEDPRFERFWSITCQGVRRHSIRLGYVDCVAFEKDHPLLIPFRDDIQRLSFRGIPQDPSAVVGDLYRVHRELADGWFRLDEYMNSMELTSLLRGGFGVLAEGPESLIARYDAVLKKHSISSFISDVGKPTFWNGAKYVEYPELTLLMLDRTDGVYVVAETFEASIAEPPAVGNV